MKKRKKTINDTLPDGNETWAIRRAYLETMLQQAPDPETMAKMAIRFTETPEEPDDFKLRNGVAIIPLTGPIFKRGSIWSYLYGGTPLSVLQTVFGEALEDDDVQAIVLDIDSPGGTVSGTESFSDIVYSSRSKKPIVAYSNGMMASAAYWIGSAADKVIVERSTAVGSIGILYVHYDWSQYDAKIGLKRTIMTGGRYKAVGNDAEPLSDDDRKVIQAEIDELYDLFIDTVARNRGVSVEVVRRDMADGRIFTGRQAVDAGLADTVGSFDAAIEQALKLAGNGSGKITTFITKEATMKNKDKATAENNTPKTVEELEAMYPDLTSRLRQQAIDDAQADTADAEKERIIGLANVHFGEEAGSRFAAIINTGVTVEQYKAIRGDAPPEGEAAESKKVAEEKAKMLEALHNAAPENPGAGASQPGGSKDFMAMVEEYQAMHKCTKAEAMAAVMKADPKAHEEYIARVN